MSVAFSVKYDDMDTKKILFVYNPAWVGMNIPGNLDAIIRKFGKSGYMTVPFRTDGNYPPVLKDVMTADDYHCVVVSGGDGTVNAIANLMLANGLDLPMGIIPSGTCNDLSRSLGMPSQLDECLDIIIKGNVTAIDAGLINDGAYFVNTCAGGIFMDVTYNTSRKLKKRIGPLAYYLHALGEMPAVRPFNIKMDMDSGTFEGDIFLFIITNGRHAGGFSNVNKYADLTDGLMDIVVIRKCKTVDIAGLFFKALQNKLLDDRNVIYFKSRYCRIESAKNIDLSIDGEKGPGLPITVEFKNKVLKVIISK